MRERSYTVRCAEAGDEAAIAALVVEGFLDKFRHIFGSRLERSVKIMEKWVDLEHSLGGISSLVIEGPSQDIAASVGIRLESSDDNALARSLWKILRQYLGYVRALWVVTLLSYPRYAASPSEAYVERLVVSVEHRQRGMARALLDAAETLGRETGKETIGLHVSDTNFRARRLYEDHGYEECSRQRSLLTGYFLGIRDWMYLQKEL